MCCHTPRGAVHSAIVCCDSCVSDQPSLCRAHAHAVRCVPGGWHYSPLCHVRGGGLSVHEGWGGKDLFRLHLIARIWQPVQAPHASCDAYQAQPTPHANARTHACTHARRWSRAAGSSAAAIRATKPATAPRAQRRSRTLTSSSPQVWPHRDHHGMACVWRYGRAGHCAAGLCWSHAPASLPCGSYQPRPQGQWC